MGALSRKDVMRLHERFDMVCERLDLTNSLVDNTNARIDQVGIDIQDVRRRLGCSNGIDPTPPRASARAFTKLTDVEVRSGVCSAPMRANSSTGLVTGV